MTNADENEHMEDATPQEMADAMGDAELQAALDPELQAGSESEAADTEDGEGAAEVDPIPSMLEQIADLNDKLLRARADVENTRRIAAREKADAAKYATSSFARDILQVADNLGMAMMTVSAEARAADKNLDNLCVGIDMTMKSLISAFEGQGIKAVEAEGKPFDHNVHEAVQQVENKDVPDGTVVQVMRPGFTINDRLLRPAQVIVSTGGPKADNSAGGVSGYEADGSSQSSAQTSGNAANQPGGNVDEQT